MCSLGCSESEDEPLIEPPITTVAGHKYSAKTQRPSDARVMYRNYQFSTDGEIAIEERLDSPKGELFRDYFGYFEYTHPVLNLEIQSVPGCSDCFNNFVAQVSNDRRSFSYTIWDISIGDHRTLTFHIQDE